VRGISKAFRNNEGHLRWYVWVVLALMLGFLLLLAARNADSHYLVGRVESIKGNMATVSVAESNRRFTAESVDPNLKVGDTVVVQVWGDQATLEATNPGMVRAIIKFKELVPSRWQPTVTQNTGPRTPKGSRYRTRSPFPQAGAFGSFKTACVGPPGNSHMLVRVSCISRFSVIVFFKSSSSLQ
jgi:hypothetical protein